MPKMKTKRAAAKRFTSTGTGKIRRRRAGLRHILTKRTQKSKKRAGKVAYLEKANTDNVKRMLPYV